MTRQIVFPFVPSLRMPPVCVRCGGAAGSATIEVKGGGSDAWGKHYEFAKLHFPVCPACEAYAAVSKRQYKQVAASVSYTLTGVNQKTGTHVKATFQNETFADLFREANVDLFVGMETAIAARREKDRWHKDDWIGLVGLAMIVIVVTLFTDWATKPKIDAPKLPVIALLGAACAGLWRTSTAKSKLPAVLGSLVVLVAGIGIAWQAAAGLGQYKQSAPGGLWWCAIASWAMAIGALAMTIVAAIWGNVLSSGATSGEGSEMSGPVASPTPPHAGVTPPPALGPPIDTTSIEPPASISTGVPSRPDL